MAAVSHSTAAQEGQTIRKLQPMIGALQVSKVAKAVKERKSEKVTVTSEE